MRIRIVRLAGAAPLATAGAVLAAPGLAQVTTDGTVGPRLQLSGPNYGIGAELGSRADSNLFHSFERFSLATGESAIFSGPDEVRNVISRVTGGTRSDIDGALRSTIPGADFFFVNPAGVVFGPNASLDVQGSFHVSTADELRFADGSVFSATDPAASSLTVAAPEAFGFLGADPASILIDRSNLQVSAGEAFSAVGGDISIDGRPDLDLASPEATTIGASGGTIALVSLASAGEVRIIDGEMTNARGGRLELRDQAIIDTSGAGGGRILIRAGEFLLKHLSLVAAVNEDSSDGSGIDVRSDRIFADNFSQIGTLSQSSGAAGDVFVAASEIDLRNASRISADSLGSGSAGSVVIEADTVRLVNGGAIGSASRAEGPGGEVGVTARDIEILGMDATQQSPVNLTGITTSSQPGSSGEPGSITIIASGEIAISGAEALISSSTRNEHDGGEVHVAADRVSVSGAASGIVTFALSGSSGDAGSVVVRANEVTVDGGLISSTARGPFVDAEGQLLIARGSAGTVRVEADRLRLIDGGQIGSSGFGLGDGGNVRVIADERIEIMGRDTDGSPSGIFASSWDEAVLVGYFLVGILAGPNIGGDIRIETPVLTLADGAEINAESFTFGAAGNVDLNISQQLLLDDAEISTEALLAGGGRIDVLVDDLIDLRESRITSAVFGGADTTAGNLSIDPRFIVLDGSRIVAEAIEGRGGSIDIEVDNLIQSPDSVISASAGPAGIDGTVVISSPEVDLTGGLVVLDPALLDAASQLHERCAARRDVGASSFTGVGRGGLPPGPDQPLMSDYRIGSTRHGDNTQSGGIEAGLAVLALACGGAL